MQSSLKGIANRARSHRKHRFGNLYGMLNESFLAESYRLMNPKAAPGVDRVSYRVYGAKLAENIRDLVARLKSKSYRARLVRRKHIPKGKGKTRPLGILVMDDKVVQTGAARLLSAIWEADFFDSSYAYRCRRNAHGAIRALSRGLQFGKYRYVVEADIKSYFDRVHHDRLMSRIAMRVRDKRVLKLIRAYLNSGILIGEVEVDTEEGTPQGGPLSPLLSNIVLDELDKELEKRGLRFVRYADDAAIYVRSPKAAERVKRSVSAFITRKLKLVVNEEKSEVSRPWHSKYLGFRITRYMGHTRIGIHAKSLGRFRANGDSARTAPCVPRSPTPTSLAPSDWFSLASLSDDSRIADYVIRMISDVGGASLSRSIFVSLLCNEQRLVMLRLVKGEYLFDLPWLSPVAFPISVNLLEQGENAWMLELGADSLCVGFVPTGNEGLHCLVCLPGLTLIVLQYDWLEVSLAVRFPNDFVWSK